MIYRKSVIVNMKLPKEEQIRLREENRQLLFSELAIDFLPGNAYQFIVEEEESPTSDEGVYVYTVRVNYNTL